MFVVKFIIPEDLDAVGVVLPGHRKALLAAVEEYRSTAGAPYTRPAPVAAAAAPSPPPATALSPAAPPAAGASAAASSLNGAEASPRTPVRTSSDAGADRGAATVFR
jgi:hypothetical protein